ncbi:MAG: hypothetical protein WCI96_14215 [Planctomycetota bacterium]
MTWYHPMKVGRLTIAAASLLVMVAYVCLRSVGDVVPAEPGSPVGSRTEGAKLASGGAGPARSSGSHSGEPQVDPQPGINPKLKVTGPYARHEMAAAFGVKDYGLLGELEKAIVVDRVNRELAGVMKSLEAIDANADSEGAWTAMIAVMKYQEALALMQRDEYLTIDATSVPREAVSGYDPMVMLNAASLAGRRVAVVVPIRVTPGGDIDAMSRLAGDASAQRLNMIVATFNTQPAEARAERIRDMLDAQSLMAEATKLQGSGKITSTEFARRMSDLNPRLPPRGVTIEQGSNTLKN